jgi:uncharacterized protein (DUF58 family)
MSLLIAAINSQINTVFIMTFLLVIVGLICMLETHENLINLSFKLISINDTHQDTPAQIQLTIQPTIKQRFGIECNVLSQAASSSKNVTIDGLNDYCVSVETPHRGYFSLPRIVVSSSFPFGIFRAWGYLYFQVHYYVYPKPINPSFWPEPYRIQQLKENRLSGNEEFYELKQVNNPWTEPRLIHWKTVAKGQGWFHKTMQSNEADFWLFSLTDLPAKDLESKLQNLSYWLYTAESQGLVYGLETKDKRTEFASGPEHLILCLRQLALYE